MQIKKYCIVLDFMFAVKNRYYTWNQLTEVLSCDLIDETKELIKELLKKNYIKAEITPNGVKNLEFLKRPPVEDKIINIHATQEVEDRCEDCCYQKTVYTTRNTAYLGCCYPPCLSEWIENIINCPKNCKECKKCKHFNQEAYHRGKWCCENTDIRAGRKRPASVNECFEKN